MVKTLLISPLPELPFAALTAYDLRARKQAAGFHEEVVAHLFTHTLAVPLEDYQFEKIVFLADHGMSAGMTVTHRHAREKNHRLEMRWVQVPA